MWPSVTRILRVADRLSDYLGERVGEVVSAYRSPAYNAMCPGAKTQSMHMRNMALDLKFKGSSPARVQNMAKAMRDRAMFAGGIGRYIDEARRFLRHEFAESFRRGQSFRGLDLMLVMAKDQKVPLGFAAGADIGAKIALEQIPSHIAAVEVVGVLKAID